MTMNFLNSFIHGNDVAEILIAGSNPYALTLLGHADVDAVRNQLALEEKLEAYLVGRVLQSGRGVWYLTSRGVVLQGMSPQGAPIKFDFAQVESAECERGKFGYTVRLMACGRAFAMYGAAAPLALAFFRALAARVTAVKVDTRRAPPLQASELLRALQCFSDAAARAQPLPGPATADAMVLVEQAGKLGMLDETQIAGIRRHLGSEAASATA